MNIKTKFNVGDEVFFLANDTVRNEKIAIIQVVVDTDNKNPQIEYNLPVGAWGWHGQCSNLTNDSYKFYPEDKVFKTKEKLVASL